MQDNEDKERNPLVMAKLLLNANMQMILQIIIILSLKQYIQCFYLFQTDLQCKDASGQSGNCITIKNCTSVPISELKTNSVQICSFVADEPIVCCPMKKLSKIQQLCNSSISARTPFPRRSDEDTCFVVGGVNASPMEFPHMAALGFGELDDIKWGCGGTLINEKYVLTAAHCLRSAALGPVKHVRLGDLNLKVTTELSEPQNYRVKRRIRHPDYKFPSSYNDIGLIELTGSVLYTPFVRYACLHTEDTIPSSLLVATGWGFLEYNGKPANYLQKGVLLKFATDNCSLYYPANSRKIKNGIDGRTQICAGDIGKDTCQGDSGGPLQMRKNGSTFEYVVVGITSFGKACALSEAPGVYTRVSAYIDWIESIAF